MDFKTLILMCTYLFGCACEKPQSMEENPDRKLRFDRYYRYYEIEEHLKRVSVLHHDVLKVENYGVSYENRNLTMVTISGTFEENRPVILVDAGVHAREWLAPAQALYIMEQLLENRELIEKVDWIIIPVANPDGYEYSHKMERQWRKTRSKGTTCRGVDLNRNFDYHWSDLNADECSIFYPGPKPFSEPEARALRDVILKYAARIKLYLSLHSAAQSFLYPWGFTTDPPENVEELRDLALNASETIYNLNKTEYRVGSSAEISGPVTGSSRDWAYGVAKIPLAYTVELRAYVDVNYDYRHEMPRERILGAVSEMFQGIKVFHRYIESKYST